MTQVAQPSDEAITAIVHGVPVDRFGKPFLTRPSDFTIAIELDKAKTKALLLQKQKWRHEHPELDERDSEDLYTLEQRKERKLLRDELGSLSEDVFHLDNHLRWLADWQSPGFFTDEINKIDEAIQRLVEFKRHLENRHLDLAHTSETVETKLRKESRIKAIKEKLKLGSATVQKKVEKKLAGLSNAELELLMSATGMSREQLAQMVGK